FWRWLLRSTWWRALVAGLTLGLAELTKSTWILLFALWPLLTLFWLIMRHRRGDPSGPHKTFPYYSVTAHVGHTFDALTGTSASPYPSGKLLQCGAILLIALYAMNLFYGFRDSLLQLDRFQFISTSLGGSAAHETPGNRFSGTWLGSILVPVPAD